MPTPEAREHRAQTAAKEKKAQARYEFAKGVAAFLTVLLLLGLLTFAVVQNNRIQDVLDQSQSQQDTNERILRRLEDVFASQEAREKGSGERLRRALEALDERLDETDRATIEALNALIRSLNESNRYSDPIPLLTVPDGESTPRRRGSPKPGPSAQPTPSQGSSPSPSPSPSPSCVVRSPFTDECIVREPTRVGANYDR